MQFYDGCHSPRKILFISAAADGHFYPLTGLAKHLQSQGHDVRWFTQSFYKEKLDKLGIPHYPYVHVPQINQENFPTFFAEREHQKSQLAKFKFDLEYVFIKSLPEGVKDLENIYAEFPFDIVIADIFSFIIPIIKA
ncbi:MAG: glycosyltransferase, partial [Chitinophagaceae bacterium]